MSRKYERMTRGGDDGAAGGVGRHTLAAPPQLSLSHPFGGMGTGPSLADAVTMVGPPCGSLDDVFQGGSELSVTVAPPALTRAVSTPEAPVDNYRPLRDDVEDDADLTQAYPLLLQRSASSAFGSPSGFCKLRPRRSHSHSGNSDPGASAFHPVWSSKSLSNSSAGSDIGSAVSSSALGSSSRSAHSDPLGERKKLPTGSSPWRLGQKVMARMKKGGRRGGSKAFKRRTLGGRENPARPSMSEDEGSPVNEAGAVVAIVSTVAGDKLAKDLFGMNFSRGDDSANNAKSSNVGGSNPSRLEKSASNAASPGSTYRGFKKSKGCDQSVTSKRKLKPAAVPSQLEGSVEGETIKAHKLEQQYDDPGVALDLSESDGDDDDTIVPIVRNYVPSVKESLTSSMRNLQQDDGCYNQNRQNPWPANSELPPPLSVDEQQCEEELPSVEVVSTSVTHGSFSQPPGQVKTGSMVLEETTAFGSTVQIFSPAESCTITEENDRSPHSLRIVSSTSIEESSLPLVKRVTVMADDKGGDNFLCQPIRRSHEDHEDEDGNHNHQNSVGASQQQDVARVPARLKYRSPRRAQPLLGSGQRLPTAPNDSPDSRLSSASSPASRVSSSNSRSTALSSGGDRTVGTLQTEGSLTVDGADPEVREANRRLSSLRGSVVAQAGGEVAAGGLDGNDTVFSSSTTSSNYHSYLQSPRPLRDGATMPVDRFFAGGNVTLSPYPSRTVYPVDQSSTGGVVGTPGAPGISRFITLSPKKLSRIGASAAGRDASHSPHTVSSNSVSNHSNNSSSSGSETTKKPLKFVAYEIKEERGSPFDEPPGAGGRAPPSLNRDAGDDSPSSSLIRPRISKGPQRPRPPISQRVSSHKPPQSPTKQDVHLSGSRTPTRTPPPPAFSGSGASTPRSPPAIVDGPDAVPCGGLGAGPTRPSVVRRSLTVAALGGGRGRGWNLTLPSSALAIYRPSQHAPPIPPRPVAAGSTGRSHVRDTQAVVGSRVGANDGAQEIVFTSASTVEGVSCLAVVSPDGRLSRCAAHTKRPPDVPIGPGLRDHMHNQGDTAAVVSPEK